MYEFADVVTSLREFHMFFCKCWVVKGPQTLEHKYGKAYMTFDTDKEARAYVEAGKAV